MRRLLLNRRPCETFGFECNGLTYTATLGRFVDGRLAEIAYTPAAIRKYEAHGRLVGQQAMLDRAPIAAPVRAEITVDLPVPASWSTKRQAAALRGEIRPTSRPDTDNYIKAALDAINAIVVIDDSLVVELAAEKRYARVPQLTITTTPLPATAANGRVPR
jgi:Holliday junction resolvase RusA-like endonuclease